MAAQLGFKLFDAHEQRLPFLLKCPELLRRSRGRRRFLATAWSPDMRPHEDRSIGLRRLIA